MQVNFIFSEIWYIREVGHVRSVGDNKGKMHINTPTGGPISDGNLDLTGWPPRDLSR